MLKWWKYRKYKKFKAKMCEGCAFRHGSPERENRFEWQDLLRDLSDGDVFSCHETMFKETPFAVRHARYDSHKTKEGEPCWPEDHFVCAGYLRLFSDRHPSSHTLNGLQASENTSLLSAFRKRISHQIYRDK